MNNIPVITRNLLIINVLAFMAQIVVDMQWPLGEGLIDKMTLYGGLFFFLDSYGGLNDYFHFWQPFTYMFLHGSFTHLFFNMFALWMFGATIERTFGPKRFLTYYLVCGIGAGVCQELVQLCSYAFFDVVSFGPTIGASGAIYGILLAFGMTFPNERIFIFPIPIPLKAKWFVALYAVVELVMAMSSSGDGVAHTAHLGGMLVGFLLIMRWRRGLYGWNYGMSDNGVSIFTRLKQAYNEWDRKSPPAEKKKPTDHSNPDHEYNARQKQRQDEIDALLDKIRKGGYDSLTKEEKKRLFDLSHND